MSAPAIQSGRVPMSDLTLAGGSLDGYAIFSNLWELFVEKGTQTVFVSVGSGSSCATELDILEMLGCKMLMADPRAAKRDAWNQVKEILSTRTSQETTPLFVQPAAKKWVLAKNIFITDAVPCSVEATGQYQGESCKYNRLYPIVNQFIADAKLQVESARVDICKIDLPNMERVILQELLESGFRPALLLIRWSTAPDSDMNTSLAAGHLQNCGYELIGKHENKYTYFYNDKNLYDICSWEDASVENPLLNSIMRSCAKQMRPAAADTTRPTS